MGNMPSMRLWIQFFVIFCASHVLAAPTGNSQQAPNPVSSNKITDTYNRQYVFHPCHNVTNELECNLIMSLWFYEAQREGVLPSDTRVWWAQNNTFLTDGKDVGLDLVGGYNDAGDYPKYGLPGSYAMMMLAWSGVDYAHGFQLANQTSWLLKTIRWGTDFIIKCHPSKDVFYYQTGVGNDDDNYWGPPLQDPYQPRKSFSLSPKLPGTDVAAQASAALSAASIVFAAVDPTYSALLRQHARDLLDFANLYRGKYSAHLLDTRQHYGSSSYQDELALGFIWSYRATGNKTDLAQAESLYKKHGLGNVQPDPPSWDFKSPYVVVLLAALTNQAVYVNDAKAYFAQMINTPVVKTGAKPAVFKTPGGLLWFKFDSPPSLVNALATSYAMGYFTDFVNSTISTTAYTQIIDSQVRYVLGCNPRKASYVAASNPTSPRNLHHPYSQSSTNINSKTPNLYPLYGAIPGGPSVTDGFQDKRSNFDQSEPALDYNGPWVGLLARAVGQGLDLQCLASVSQ
ncbi:cellulase [Synchytrium microbalum]|uniref:cellulase n=1 Tax=Synchytrium microbalum TaxID=1806994 RepID=A0A507BSG6_9FUNG|nr:cellulase [Synchytrium microbalum]TPX30612.1 cellulase [Synchytrium microbalum]